MPDATCETRTVAAAFEMRDDTATGASVFEGYASVFDTPYSMGPFWEQVDKRAFNRTLNASPDVRLLVDHTGQPLARTKSGTLELHADTQGLHARATLDNSDPDVQRILPKMRRGDLDQMSFSFRVVGAAGDEWDYGVERTLRTLRELSLADQDVSIVTYPASHTTSASVRDARHLLSEQMHREMRNGRTFAPIDLARLRRNRQCLDAELRMTANDTLDSLNEAVGEACEPDDGSYAYAFVVDYDDTNVWYTVYTSGDDDSDTWQQAYTLAADGMATLTGLPLAVRRRTSWVLVTDPEEVQEDLAVARTGRPLDLARRIAVALEL